MRTVSVTADYLVQVRKGCGQEYLADPRMHKALVRQQCNQSSRHTLELALLSGNVVA